MSTSGLIDPHPFQLSGEQEFQLGIAQCKIGLPIDVKEEPDKPGSYVVFLKSGAPIGRIGGRHSISVLISSGYLIQSASVNSIGEPNPSGNIPAPRIRIVARLADAGWAPSAWKRDGYIIHIVGEQFYRNHVAACEVGEEVRLRHEPNNPYDTNAIGVSRLNGDIIGHLPRNSWLHPLLLKGGREHRAFIATARKGRRDFKEISLRINLQDADS